MKEIVQDQYGNTIYLTDERWSHIAKRHHVLKNFKNETLKTIRIGKRNQDDLHPDQFFYRQAFNNLPFNYTHIEVVVVFRFRGGQPNNFVVTAYPITKT
ncbi:MAG: hypothetical protein ONB44_00485 [candidate division KSB1 bacterium]|nr:hypothetical protein [candidate division KSB1 bacterium]MDZ7300597.1 hypothetical protein [candidate division KSB1 bacterium]MDZ7309734.1 hypothetical protein [candidate division KSB1 bacterium]